MKEKLKQLIGKFKEQKVVERIATANEHYEEAVKMQKFFQKELEELKEMLKYAGPIDYGEICQEEAIEIFLICFMADIEERELLMDKMSLFNSLRGYKGRFEDSAWEMSDYLMDIIKEKNKKLLMDSFFILR